MRLRPFILFSILILSAFAHQTVAAEHDPILKEIKPGAIIIIGESHKKIESVQLFQGLVTDYLKQGQCLAVGLEIASNQQAVIDRIMQGRAAAADMEIAPMIEHPPFRKMIDDLAALKRNGACLKLVAIDAGNEIDMKRDEWMAVKLAELGKEEPILVLLGALHSLKKVNWDLSMVANPRPHGPEILESQGHRVKSYPQRWLKGHCNGNQNQYRSRYISANDPDALSLLNESLISLINAHSYKSVIGIIDGFK